MRDRGGWRGERTKKEDGLRVGGRREEGGGGGGGGEKQRKTPSVRIKTAVYICDAIRGTRRRGAATHTALLPRRNVVHSRRSAPVLRATIGDTIEGPALLSCAGLITRLDHPVRQILEITTASRCTSQMGSVVSTLPEQCTQYCSPIH